MEYTLEDAFETLKDHKAELEKKIEDLTNIISNNPVFATQPSCSANDLKIKQEILQKNLLAEIQKVQPEDYAIPRTSDLRTEVMKELKEEVHDMQQLINNLEKKFSEIQEDIMYLKNKKNGLNKMKEAYLDAIEISTNRTYIEECTLIKRIFQETKKDLHTLVDTLFPNNDMFKQLLSVLTSAYMKGGDDVYIDIKPEDTQYVNFLLEADIVQYHRNDKTKIRMTELL